MNPATIVSAAAISGESQPMSLEGSARASSLSRMADLIISVRDVRLAVRVRPHSAHPHADLLDIRLANGFRGREASLGDDHEPVAHLEELVQFFRDDQNRNAIVTEID